VLLVGELVRLRIGRTRVLAQVGRLGQLVLQEQEVLRQGPSVLEPDPRLGDVRVAVEPPGLHTALVGRDQVLVAHEVLLDLLDLVPGEAGAAVGPGGLAEVVGDPVHVAVVGPEPVVRLV